MEDADLALALLLQEEFDEEYTYSEKLQKKSFLDISGEHNPKVSLIDPSLEFTDPTPNIFRMFVNFDKRFFWSSLGSVEVMWSPRMTSCAGICRYRCGSGATTIHLSLPLLKLRPRKDLVETLLHEMIHAYLFVTKNNKDRDGHGPEFQSHMHRINQSAGTKITIYHSFHAEVNVYKTHWWRCNGPCQYQKPFYGLVKRSMNRAPGPNDFWYDDHQRNCGGVFVKVKEPENFKSKKNTSKSSEKGNSPSKLKTMHDYFKKGNTNRSGTGSGEQGFNAFKVTSTTKTDTSFPMNKGGAFTARKPDSSTKTKGGTFTTTKGGSYTTTVRSTSTATKADTSTNAGASRETKNDASTRGVMTFSDLTNEDPQKTSKPQVIQNIVFSGKGYTLGRTSVPVTDKPWLKRFNTDIPCNSANNPGHLKKSPNSTVASLNDSKKVKIDDSKEKSAFKETTTVCTVACPACNKSVKASEVNQHLDLCLTDIFIEEFINDDRCAACSQTLGRKCDVPTLCSVCEHGACSNDFDSSDTQSDNCSITCPMCEAKMIRGDLERHLEFCIGNEDEDNQTRICDEEDDIMLN